MENCYSVHSSWFILVPLVASYVERNNKTTTTIGDNICSYETWSWWYFFRSHKQRRVHVCRPNVDCCCLIPWMSEPLAALLWANYVPHSTHWDAIHGVKPILSSATETQTPIPQFIWSPRSDVLARPRILIHMLFAIAGKLLRSLNKEPVIVWATDISKVRR